MGENGESSCSRQVYPPEVGYGPATPGKPYRSELNTISHGWLNGPFDEIFFEETSATKSAVSCWEGNNLGSTSQIYDIGGGMCNAFSVDDVETWNSISCRDLLALADTGIQKGSGDGSGGGAETSMPIGDHDGSNGFDMSQECEHNHGFVYNGWLNLGYTCDLNLPPQTAADTQEARFTPVTPDEARRAEHKRMASDLVAKLVQITKKGLILPQVLIEQLQADASTLVEVNQDVEKGLTAETNLNETPQPKQRRRKHRPKVVREGQPKKAKQTPTPAKADGTPTGKRKYVRKKGVEKSPATPAVEEANGTVDPSSEQKNKKSCRKKINFDETEQGAEVTVERTEVNITVDKTCSMNQVVETYETTVKGCQALETTLEAHFTSPITPSKTELPLKDAKHTHGKAKCRINFLQETHDKGPSIVSSPNESNSSTTACFNKGEAQGSKGLSSKIDGMELWDENAIGVGCNLSKFTNDNSGSNQGMHLPTIYKKKRIEKCQTFITSGAISSGALHKTVIASSCLKECQ
ncbi:LOW QUALITY PROTEIN: hypothetical protein OSB04_009624 [Centaurea solstitialis]|uniref:Uncharacterized protein n=1 Tax=Centaurea solstitialis TaxID=347529 RepID=A0AA38THT5_9ASTR|nr:LOW QUALITY PROTEIN: hypothetical protein OSB04_009624 [Centaurea solstitialis]